MMAVPALSAMRPKDAEVAVEGDGSFGEPNIGEGDVSGQRGVVGQDHRCFSEDEGNRGSFPDWLAQPLTSDWYNEEGQWSVDEGNDDTCGSGHWSQRQQGHRLMRSWLKVVGRAMWLMGLWHGLLDLRLGRGDELGTAGICRELWWGREARELPHVEGLMNMETFGIRSKLLHSREENGDGQCKMAGVGLGCDRRDRSAGFRDAGWWSTDEAAR